MVLCQIHILGKSLLEVHLGTWIPPPSLTAVILIMQIKIHGFMQISIGHET